LRIDNYHVHGGEVMTIADQLRERGARKRSREIAIRLLEMENMSLEEIANICSLALEEVEKLEASYYL
jgi:predicted HTH domain antitoxin